MAFIREYMNAGTYAGDPGFGKWLKKRLKPPKALRKLQPLKALGRLAKKALPLAGMLVPGGFALSFGARLAQYLSARGVPPQQAVALVEEAGYPVEEEPTEELYEGDAWWMGDPGAKPKTPKRKTAASGGRVKAQRKAAAKTAPKAKKKGSSARGGEKLEDLGEAILRNLPGGQAGLGIIEGITGGKKPRGMPGFGRGRRTMRPTNVKALRRAVRRLEGFQRLVKSVEKQLPALRRARRSSGHASGCRCVACKRRAA